MRPRIAGSPKITVRLGVLACIALLTACASQTPPAPSVTTSSTAIDTEPPGARTIATELNAPWSMVFAEGALIVSERDSGRIVEIDAAGHARQIIHLDDVVHGGEGGLLGLAFQQPYLFVYSTAQDGNRIQRFELAGKSGALTLGNPRTILSGLPSARVHNGGRLAIGPDSMLYVTVGDAGNESSAQDLESLGGKILRLTVQGEVPEDNPFPGSPVFSFGHRNPQGVAWAPDGTMYASEFGQNRWDELNIIEPGGNYGWPVNEGIAEDAEFRDPVQQWSTQSASPSGITIHDGVLYIANLRGERLRSVDLSAPDDSSEYFVGEHGRLRDVTISETGQLLILTNNTDGRGTPQEDDDRIIGISPEVLTD
ncbi:PQQ-dependent sugar dehydrogenase [Glutamicibacter arilaitensis]|uniref:PQQ-dependent sugar dehydrogenase n=1 Tax=Glutamicibacter arilaitensis TaxID=256701 RepID=UPI0038500516